LKTEQFTQPSSICVKLLRMLQGFGVSKAFCDVELKGEKNFSHVSEPEAMLS
jgi:hypothetical protein